MRDRHRRAEILVVIHRAHRPGARRHHRLARERRQIHPVVRPPVVRRLVPAQRLHAVRLRLRARHRPDPHRLRLRAHLVVAAHRRRFLRRLPRRRVRALLCRLLRRLRNSRLRLHRQRRFLQRVFLRDRAGHKYIARNSHCRKAQEQDYVIALFPQERPNRSVFSVFIVLHKMHLRR